MSYIDLFGNVCEWQPRPRNRHGKLKPKANGYGGAPGSGPVGQTCATCEHKTRIEIRSGRKFWKCLKFVSPIAGTKQWPWSGSLSSDIRLRSPACRLWEQSLSKTPKQFGMGVGNRNAFQSKPIK